MHAICDAFEIKVFHPKAYRPQGNSYAEQSVGKWKTFAKRIFINAGMSPERVSKVSRYPNDWDQYVDWGMLTINRDINNATDRQPQHLMINQGNRLRQYIINENALRKQKNQKSKSSKSSSSSSLSRTSSYDSSENEPIVSNKKNINLNRNEKELATNMLFDESQYEDGFHFSEKNCFGQNSNNPKQGILKMLN